MAGQSKATKHPDPTSNNKKKQNPCILQWNMRGMGTQGDELKSLVKEFNPIAIFLQETKFKFQYLVKDQKTNCLGRNNIDHCPEKRQYDISRRH